MTSHKPEEDKAGVDLAELSEALGQKGDLIPETLDEVRLAEEALSEETIELPEGLRDFTTREERRSIQAVPKSHAPSDKKKMGVVIPLFAAGAGFAVAAAALFALFWPDRGNDPPPIAGTPDELTPDRPPDEKIKLTLDATCKDCCAGSACREAKSDLKQCASGRTCVPCRVKDQQNAYKIRLSALHVRPEEQRWFDVEQLQLHELELCALARGKPLGCRPAGEGPDDLLNWSSLPTASTREQLVGGIEIRLVSRDRGTVAEWKNSVLMSSETLCRGVAAILDAGKGGPVGKVSAFFDDAYFVEIARAESVNKLDEHRARMEGQTDLLAIYKTSQSGDGTFVLVAGPLAREPAEAVRWQLLDQGVQAKITFGEDHEGRPRPER